MLPESYVEPQLALMPGKYAQPPNQVLVPTNRKTFKIEVSLTMSAEETCVIVSPNKTHSHEWCVLDKSLKQVMVGSVRHGLRVGKTEPICSRTVMADARNPDDFDIELASAKLKSGASYTLVVQTYGVLSMLDFVALKPAKRKNSPRKKPLKKSRPKKIARRKVAKKAKAKKTARRKAA